MNKVTFVSALFNINRVDRRKWEEYLKWFDVTLKLKVPMILFVQEDLKEFIEERRSMPTEIIVQTVEEIPYYYLKDQIQEILDSEDYKKKMSDPERIECKQAMYSVIIYSKFPWMMQAVELNPYQSDYFFWLDAGGSKFFDGFDLTQDYPSKKAIKSFEKMEERLLVQMNFKKYPDLCKAKELPLDYLYDHRSYIATGMFGSHKNAISKVRDMIDDILLNKMIKNKNVNNEQIALGYLIKKHPDKFALYSHINNKPLALFTEIANRGKILEYLKQLLRQLLRKYLPPSIKKNY